MSDARTVSQILLEDYQINLRVGAKGECPFCHRNTFSIKPGDGMGKCFSPGCGRIVTQRQSGPFSYGLSTVLERVAAECHQELMRLASVPNQQNAYTYLRDERHIHPQVIAEALLGAVPAQYDVRPYFEDPIAEVQKALDAMATPGRGRPSKRDAEAKERLERRLQTLQESQGKLGELLEKYSGWVVFVYSDAAHHPVALRLREPYQKRFVSFKPGIPGVFGHELFTPYKSQAHQQHNHDLLVVEGEFNLLQLQSLVCRYAEAIKESPSYALACAVGSASNVDVGTITRLAKHPVVCYDNDADEAGLEVVKRLQQRTLVEACTTPKLGSDLDEYIVDFGADAVAAWNAVRQLVADRKPYGRSYSLSGEEFFDHTITSPKSLAFIPKLLGEALMERQTYRYAGQTLWAYESGVYVPGGEAILDTEAQRLLGPNSTRNRKAEALSYVVAEVRSDYDDPQAHHTINLQNGRLDWHTMQLLDHTPKIFSTIQLPLVYDASATCPKTEAFLLYAVRGDLNKVRVLRAFAKAVICQRIDLQRFLELIGPGGTGKGTYARMLQALVGVMNVVATELKHMEANRFEMSSLRGKALLVVTDAERYSGPVTALKAVTGEDMLRSEAKYEKSESRFEQVMVLIAANEPIVSSDYTSGLERRRLSMTFAHKPAVKRDLLAYRYGGWQGELADERPGMLNWVLAMPDSEMEDLIRNTTTAVPSLQKEWAEALIQTNPLAAWANRHILLDVSRDDDGNLTSNVNVGVAKRLTNTNDYEHQDVWLYPNYCRWAEDTHTKPLSQNRFTGLLKDLFGHQLNLKDVYHTDGRRGSRFWGIKIRPSNDAVSPLFITEALDE
jgi:phage/plasmid-associated DNA primase